MGSRSGSLDPGILIHLLRQGIEADKLDEILNKASGLQGISGGSGDMRQIISEIAAGNSRAQLAFDMYVYRLRSHIGAMVATLGGLDALVFTGGVGENQPSVRSAACEKFEFLGLKLDSGKNSQPLLNQDISAADSTVRVLVIQAEEDWAIATQCWNLTQHSNL